MTGTTVDELESRVTELAGPTDEAEAAELAEAMADLAVTYGDETEFEYQAGQIADLAELRAEYDTEPVRAALVRALSGATQIEQREAHYDDSSDVDFEQLEGYVTRLGDLYDETAETTACRHLARGHAELVYGYGWDENTDAVTEHVDELAALDGASEDATVAEQYARGLAYQSLWNEETIADNVERVEDIYERHPGRPTAHWLAGLLAFRVQHAEDAETVEQTLRRIESLHEKHGEEEPPLGIDDTISGWFAVAGAYGIEAAIAENDEELVDELVELAERAREDNENRMDPSTWAAGVFNAASTWYFENGNLVDGHYVLDSLEAIHERYETEFIRGHLADAMGSALLAYYEAGDHEEAEALIDQINAMDEAYDGEAINAAAEEVSELYAELEQDTDTSAQDAAAKTTSLATGSTGTSSTSTTESTSAAGATSTAGATSAGTAGTTSATNTGNRGFRDPEPDDSTVYVSVSPLGLSFLVAAVFLGLAQLPGPASDLFAGFATAFENTSVLNAIFGAGTTDGRLLQAFEYFVYYLGMMMLSGGVLSVGVRGEHQFSFPGFDLLIHNWPVGETDGFPTPKDDNLPLLLLLAFFGIAIADFGSLPLLLAFVALYTISTVPIVVVLACLPGTTVERVTTPLAISTIVFTLYAVVVALGGPGSGLHATFESLFADTSLVGLVLADGGAVFRILRVVELYVALVLIFALMGAIWGVTAVSGALLLGEIKIRFSDWGTDQGAQRLGILAGLALLVSAIVGAETAMMAYLLDFLLVSVVVLVVSLLSVFAVGFKKGIKSST